MLLSPRNHPDIKRSHHVHNNLTWLRCAKSSSAGSGPVKELTLRGIVITLVFTAANVYLGLKVGLTFATSIPAAIISMAILRRFSDHTIQENNIVQTIASAAGALSAIIFVLPGLIIVGWWTGFPYLQTVLVIILGGILGVTYSIPLRRALVTNSDLPYPEGVAGAEVLRVGDTSEGAEESSRGLGVIVRGSIASAALYFLNALKAISVDISGVFRVGAGATMMGTSLSLALAGVGHLVGVGVVIAIDEILRRNTKYSLPPLAVGMGMYLPTAVTVMIPFGAALGHLYDRWSECTTNPERAKRMGTLMATGLIVGESLAGVVYAGIVVAFGGKADPLAIMPEGFAGIAPWVAVVLFVGTLWYLYRGARQESARD